LTTVRTLCGITLKWLALGALFLPGCLFVMAPGELTEHVSDFDQAIELSMEPAWLYGGTHSIKWQLSWRSTMPPNEFFLRVDVTGSDPIALGQSLHIKLDGKQVDLSTLNPKTGLHLIPGGLFNGIELPSSTWWWQRYQINRELLEQLLKAHDVRVRVDLGTSYAEGVFSNDAMTMARPAFHRFYDRWLSLQKPRHTQSNGYFNKSIGLL
jgi:hypothetical protein